MSLRDTIEGAREEANPVGVSTAEERAAKKAEKKRKKEEGDTVLVDTAGESKGFSRKSAASAKPAREAASSVRVVSKTTVQNETKEEKKERKRREREEDDLRERALDVVLKSSDKYNRTTQTWWFLLGFGLVCAVFSLLFAYWFDSDDDTTTYQTVFSTVLLIGAFGCIIGAFIYDLVKRRPLRNNASARLYSMSDKKVEELLEIEKARVAAEDRAAEEEKEAKKAEKEAKKAARKAKRRGEPVDDSASEKPKDSKY